MFKVKEILRKNEFNPGLIGLITNPFFIARKGLSAAIKEFSNEINGRILDVGCGTKPYEKFFSFTEYVGLEYDTGIDQDKKTADYYYSGDTFPFDDKSFDSAICNQVLEHVFNSGVFLSEINRILKPSGKLLLTVPFVWDEHEQPYDFARYSSFGLNHILSEKGFKVYHQKKTVPDFRTIIQLANAYFYKITRGIPVLKQIVQILLIFPVTLAGIIISLILPQNKDLYLDNVLLCEKVRDS
jgi:SAM-dependent methyltransferase